MRNRRKTFFFSSLDKILIKWICMCFWLNFLTVFKWTSWLIQHCYNYFFFLIFLFPTFVKDEFVGLQFTPWKSVNVVKKKSIQKSSLKINTSNVSMNVNRFNVFVSFCTYIMCLRVHFLPTRFPFGWRSVRGTIFCQSCRHSLCELVHVFNYTLTGGCWWFGEHFYQTQSKSKSKSKRGYKKTPVRRWRKANFFFPPNIFNVVENSIPLRSFFLH